MSTQSGLGGRPRTGTQDDPRKREFACAEGHLTELDQLADGAHELGCVGARYTIGCSHA
jgi:hypothetical protein